MTPLQVAHAGQRYGADDPAAAAKFAAALTAATRVNATVSPSVRYCQAPGCGQPIRGLLACCQSPVCVDATSAAEKRADRWAD
jgi:hypothetical protein